MTVKGILILRNLYCRNPIYRDCQIIDRNDRVIVVEASSGDENKGEQPTIQFTPTEDSLVRVLSG